MASLLGSPSDRERIREGMTSLHRSAPTLAVKPMDSFWRKQLSKAMVTQGNTILARNNHGFALFLVCELKGRTLLKEHNFFNPYRQQALEARKCSLDICTSRRSQTGFPPLFDDPANIMVVSVLRPELRHVKHRLQDIVEERLRLSHFPEWLPRCPREKMPGWDQREVSWAALEQYATPLTSVDFSNFEICIHPHELVLNKVLHNNACQSRFCVDRYDTRSREEVYKFCLGLRNELRSRIGAAEFDQSMAGPARVVTQTLCMHCFGIGMMYDELFRIAFPETFLSAGYKPNYLGRTLLWHLGLVWRLQREYGYPTEARTFYLRAEFLAADTNRLYIRTDSKFVIPDVKLLLAEHEPKEFWRMVVPLLPGWDEACAICREEYMSVALVVRLQCGHHFHEECLSHVFMEDSKCPLCRSQVIGKGVELRSFYAFIGSLAGYLGIQSE